MVLMGVSLACAEQDTKNDHACHSSTWPWSTACASRRLMNQRQAYKSDRSVLAVKRNQDVQLAVLERVTEIVKRKQETPLHFVGTHERR